jgi:GalNAc5-diNAcBac-PP-undecaprenol beta-1,3-glucosyltransferase
MKKVTIIMATFNRAHLIMTSLESILKQTYTNWECFVIDDGGTDNTLGVIQPLIDKDIRFQYLKRKEQYKKGLPGCRNFGLDLGTGDYTIFFDDDDIVHPKLLKECLDDFLEHKGISFIHFQKEPFIGEFDTTVLNNKLSQENKTEKNNLYEKSILGLLPLASCTVMWKSDFLKNNYFNEELMYAEEWEFYSRLLIKENVKGLISSKILYFNRKHPESNTGEFWNHNPIRLKSKIDACILLTQFLVDNNKLTKKIVLFFIKKSYRYNEKKIVLPILKSKIKYQLLYLVFPFRFKLYKLKNKWLKKY